MRNGSGTGSNTIDGLEPVKPETGRTGLAVLAVPNRTDLEPNRSESGFDETEPNRTPDILT